MRLELKKRRVSCGLTQSEMAEKIGVGVSMYCLLEQGKKYGTIKGWLKVQKALKINDKEMWKIIKEK